LYGLVQSAQVVFTERKNNQTHTVLVGPIAGGVVGGAVLIAIAATLAILRRRRLQRRKLANVKPFASDIMSGAVQHPRTKNQIRATLQHAESRPRVKQRNGPAERGLPASDTDAAAPASSSPPSDTTSPSSTAIARGMSTNQLLEILTERINIEHDEIGDTAPPDYTTAVPDGVD
jgi:hypothetical protein